MNFRLKTSTSPEWVETVLKRFDQFLVDHAACERKASATAIKFVVHYRDRPDLMEPMIRLAREELDHFSQVYALMKKRKISLGSDERDPYVSRLRKLIRGGKEERFLDLLIIASVIEARGCERFGLLAEASPDREVKEFYGKLAQSEQRHQSLFLQLALTFFKTKDVQRRLDAILDHEAEIVTSLPIRAALH